MSLKVGHGVSKCVRNEANGTIISLGVGFREVLCHPLSVSFAIKCVEVLL